MKSTRDPSKPSRPRLGPPDFGALSAHALEELRAIVEAAADVVPTAMLSELAALELAEAGVVVRLDDDLQRVHIPEHLAVAALAPTGAVPCRLPLLLHGLDDDARDAVARRVPEPLITTLTQPTSLGHVLLSLPPAAMERLWAIVDSGGYLTFEPGEEGEPASPELRALEERALLLPTPHDRRVPAEVLRALLEGRLLRQLQALQSAWRRVCRGRRHDNLVMFPFHAGRVLADLGELLLDRPAWPLEELGVALGLHTQEVPVDALVDLAEVLSIARRRGQSCSAGVALRVQRRYQQWRALSEAERIQRLLDALLQGAPTSPLEAPLAALLGAPDPTLHPEHDEQDTSGWGALPPHVVAAMDPSEILAGYAYGRDFARLLIYQALASLEPGHLYPLEALTAVAQHAADAARTFSRLAGLLYGPTPPPPTPEAAAQAVLAWVRAVAQPLGWAVLEEERPAAEAPLPAPGRRDEATLPLFDLEARTPQPLPAPAAAQAHRAWVRIVQPWPAVDAHLLRGFAEELGRDGEGLLEGLLAPWGEGSLASADAARPWRRADADPHPWSEALERVLAEGLDPRLVPALRHLDASLRRAACALEWSEIGYDAIAHAFAELLRGRRAERDRSALRRAFLALDALCVGLRAQGIRPGFRAVEVRQRLEGPILRAESVEHAIRSFQGRVPPAELLAARPELALKGALRVVGVDREGSIARMIPLDPDAAARLGALAVRLDPRPLCFLRVGDTLDATLVRYGEVGWLSQLRWLLPEPLAALRPPAPREANKAEQRRPSLD